VLLERLGTRLDVLGSGPVDLPERQRTLRATTGWSVGLLRPPEQALFAELAVFSGGWTLESAEVVCGRDVLDGLAALLDASLLVESGDGRFDMLGTVRAYALDELATRADRADTERRHTEWVLAALDPRTHSGAAEFRQALAFFDRERANVRAAVERAIRAADVGTAALLIAGLFGYAARRDTEREIADWLDRVLRHPAGPGPRAHDRGHHRAADGGRAGC
jgi:predicted ATPase